MMRSSRWFRGAAPLVAALVWTSSACARQSAQVEASQIEAVEEAAATITPEDMRTAIATIADDSMGGRDTPSAGLDRTAQWIADQYAADGLAPGGDDGTFFQRYAFPLRALDTTGVHFGTVVDGENVMLGYGTDYFVAPAVPFDDRAMGHGSLVWVGRSADGSWPQVESARGQVMVVSLPGAYDRDWRIAAAHARRTAQAAGARALLVALGNDFPEIAFKRLSELAAEPSRSLVDPGEIPVFYLRPAAAATLLARGGLDLAALAAGPAEPQVVPGVEAHYSADAVIVEDATAPNVVAVLRGGDPELSDTYVIFSAHMDHVGIGTANAAGDSIYNGADDDASGTAALVEMAEAFSTLAEPPRRSLVFLNVSGEEKGLLGSRWFTEHPTIPVDRIVADVNMDMIARNAPDSIVVIGQQYSSLGPLVQGVAAEHPELGLTVSEDLWPEERFFFRSDHFNFARLEIPALFFFAGVHEDYHQPSDELAKLDLDKAARVARLAFWTAYAIADSPAAPTWTEQGLQEVRALTR
ncbi:MAG TPA: M20/M25/M40 family metallo-hydrolase [Gemmatimonadota bacterium]|jgi:Zn-dependent M28 family amino/carboxypeptidase|nr:M20/M25/M40 family metallo-hydrolase [Gemmatimonadota bacterium]